MSDKPKQSNYTIVGTDKLAFFKLDRQVLTIACQGLENFELSLSRADLLNLVVLFDKALEESGGGK